ncbi:MAG: hypothetical protein IJN50_05585 [Clostridia bacterium]|nr:hypothetical protein [Clostridia bacterium]
MIEKFLNKRVQIVGTVYSRHFIMKGIMTACNNEFVELDNNEIIAIKYIFSVKSL